MIMVYSDIISITCKGRVITQRTPQYANYMSAWHHYTTLIVIQNPVFRIRGSAAPHTLVL